MTRAYEEIIEFIAAGTTPKSLINFQPSEVTQDRVIDLILREKTEGITDEEKVELDQYLMLEPLIHWAKARAYQCITAS